MPSGGYRKGSLNDPLVNMEEGDNTKMILANLSIRDKLCKEKVDMQDPQAVYDRALSYFNLMAEMDKRPTWTGLCMAWGYSRSTIIQIEKNLPFNRPDHAKWAGFTDSGTPPETREVIAWAREVMTSLWEDYMQNGKIHPTAGIFIGKNFYQMKDVVENVVTTPDNPIDHYNAEDIASRYITDESQAEVPPKKRKPKSDS